MHYICVLNTVHFSRASKKHQFSWEIKKAKSNSTFKSWKCCFNAEFEGGLYFNTRLNWKCAFRSKTACRGVRVSGGDLCTKCRSTDRAGRRDQVLLPLPKRNSHRFGDCFFFVRQNLSEARACRGEPPCRRRWQMQRGEDGAAVKRGCEATLSPSVKTPLKSVPLS